MIHKMNENSIKLCYEVPNVTILSLIMTISYTKLVKIYTKIPF